MSCQAGIRRRLDLRLVEESHPNPTVVDAEGNPVTQSTL
jgi:hypothetical protein